MYFNSFECGVLVTLAVEFMVLIIAALIARKNDKEYQTKRSLDNENIRN